MKARAQDRLLYVGFYDSSIHADEQRMFWLSAASKMDYVANSVRARGTQVRIVSPAWTTAQQGFPGRRTTLRDGVELELFRTFPWGNRVQRAVSLVASRVLLFLYLVVHTRRHQNVLVYHSLSLMRAVRWARKVRGFRLVLELEEIYQDVVEVSARTARAEHRIIDEADAFVFSTGLLSDRVGADARPRVVIHGNYDVAEDRGLSFDDGRVHVVYAGRIDAEKGAFTAVSAAGHLGDQYHVHVAGFGEPADIARLQKSIAQVGSTTSARVTYDGVLAGDEFTDLLQKCSVGLCTQSPDAAFNDTSFPSKVLAYMTNGLTVVSVRMRSLEESALAPEIVFYDGADPLDAAAAIREASGRPTDRSRDRVQALDRICIQELGELLDESAG
jgi:glycosyltransferase involved in cell wall biosynthesis